MNTTIAAPFREYKTVVAPEWIDANNHMNVLYYSHVIFGAHAMFSRHLGIGEDYVHATGCGKSVVESHIVYERELLRGDRIEVASRLLGVGDKRVHFYHEIFNVDRGYRAAVGEQLDIHVDLNTRRASPFPHAMRARLEAIAQVHAQLPAADKVGRRVTIEKPAQSATL
ncbi:MAG TPA: thioesterase family protein [Spongiibacteraceae bacterium]